MEEAAAMVSETVECNGVKIRRGGNRLSRNERANLTALGRRLQTSLADEGSAYIWALADAVARAEGTDFAGQPCFGYLEALGRYRLLDRGEGPSFRRTDVGHVFVSPPEPSPAVQDLLFVYALYKRGVYWDVVDRRRPDLALRVRGGNPPIRGLTVYAPLAPEFPSLENERGLGFYRSDCTWFGRQARSLPFLRERLSVRLGVPHVTTPRGQLGRAVSRLQQQLVRAGYLGQPAEPSRAAPPLAQNLVDLARGMVLREGARGRAVEKLQQQLVRTGYLTPSQFQATRGIFGPETRVAVETFQTSERLDPAPGTAGMVGQTTWSWLLNSPDGTLVDDVLPPVRQREAG